MLRLSRTLSSILLNVTLQGNPGIVCRPAVDWGVVQWGVTSNN